MENTQALPLSTNYAKPKLGSYFSRYEKLRVIAMGAGVAAGLVGAAHFYGLGEWLDPTYPLATPAELDPATYAHLPDPRGAMMETLSHRLNLESSCSFETDSDPIYVYAGQRPWDLPEGGQEINVPSDEYVFLACAGIVRREFSEGQNGRLIYSVNIQNAWNSSGGPGFGPFEDGDENGNGIINEPISYHVGNPADNHDAIEGLIKAQQEYISLRAELQNREPSLRNAWNDVKLWAEEKYNAAMNSISEQIDQEIDRRVEAAKQSFWQSMPSFLGGGSNEASPL